MSVNDEQATDLFRILDATDDIWSQTFGRQIGGEVENPMGDSERRQEPINGNLLQAEESRPENQRTDVSPGDMGMTHSDPLLRELSGIRNALNRIADLMEQKETVQTVKPIKMTNETLELDDPFFNTWWKLYPRKVGKDKARKAWVKYATTQGKAELLIKDMEVRAKAWEGTTDLRFIPHPSSFLNGKGWLDPIEHAIPKQNKEPKTDQEWLNLAHQKGINTVGLTLNQLKDRIRTS